MERQKADCTCTHGNVACGVDSVTHGLGWSSLERAFGSDIRLPSKRCETNQPRPRVQKVCKASHAHTDTGKKKNNVVKKNESIRRFDSFRSFVRSCVLHCMHLPAPMHHAFMHVARGHNHKHKGTGLAGVVCACQASQPCQLPGTEIKLAGRPACR